VAWKAKVYERAGTAKVTGEVDVGLSEVGNVVVVVD
jgi:hypothetical protein